MKRERLKVTKVTSPSRRPALRRLVDDRNSDRKKPKGIKTTRLDIISERPVPLLHNNLEKSNVKLYPVSWLITPQYRITTAVSSKSRPTYNTIPKAIAPYTEHFFLKARNTIIPNDTTSITAQCVLGTRIKIPRI